MSFSRCSPRSVSAQFEQLGGRGRKHYLSPVRGAHDPRGEVHVHPHILGRVEARLARVHADANADRPFLQARRRLAHGRDRLLRRGKGVEEGVAFVVDLVARIAGKAPRTMRRCSARASR